MELNSRSITNQKDELPTNTVWWISVVSVFLIAFALRIIGFADRPLWFDEAIEYWMAILPLSQISQAVAGATHDPPLYSYLLHFWMTGGIAEFWLRVPSLVASLLSVAGVICLGRMLSGRLVGILAGLLLAVSAADIRYAQEVGQYSLMVCLTTWNLLFLYKATREDRWRWWGLWGLTALLNIYSHYGAAIIILTTAVTVLIYHLWQRRWTMVWRQVIIGVIVAILLLPLVLIIIPQQLGRLGATTQPLSLSSLWQTSWLILVFQLTSNPGIMAWPWPELPRWLVAVPPGLAILISLTRTRWLLSPTVLLLISWLGYYLIGLTGAYFFSPTRHSLLLVPLLVLSIATGIAVAFRWHRLAGIGLMLPILLVALWIPREAPEDLRTITQYWQANRQPGDATYVYYGAAPGFRYQLDLLQGASSELPIHWYGRCYQGQPELYCREGGVYYGRWTRSLPAADQRAALEEVIGSSPDRLWVILSHVHQTDRDLLLSGLEPDYRIVLEQRMVNEGAILLEKRANSTDP